jgi:hypothetical protein
VNDTGGNLYGDYRENPFSVLESPVIVFEDDAARAAARQTAERRGLPYLDEEPLEIDAASAARVGREELLRLGAVPVRSGDGAVRIVLAEISNERIAAVREHFSTDVTLGVVTNATLERLLDATPTSTAPSNREAGILEQDFERVLNLFDEEADRFNAVRQKLQQLGGQMHEREQHVHQLEADMARLRVEAQQSELTIDRLRRELSDREGRLERAAAKAQELAAIVEWNGPR